MSFSPVPVLGAECWAGLLDGRWSAFGREMVSIWTGDGQHGQAWLLKYLAGLAAAAAVSLGSVWAACWAVDFAATC